MKTALMTVLLASFFVGCSFAARNETMYKKDTRELLETRNGEVKGCYDGALKTDGKAAGVVVVRFTVQAETGHVVNPEVDTARSTAPTTLSDCVVEALSGLTLDPGDARDGDGTFTWEFAAR